MNGREGGAKVGPENSHNLHTLWKPRESSLQLRYREFRPV